MEVKQVIAESPLHPSDSLNRAGARCVMCEGSDFLFLERAADADLILSKQTVSKLNSLNSVASEDSVVLLDGDYRVEALVALTRLDDLSINDFSQIHTIALVPQLTHRLGEWKRGRKIRDGLWSVSFKSPTASDDALWQMLEYRILKPWATRRKVHRYIIAPSKIERLLQDADRGMIHLTGHERTAMWAFQLVTADLRDAPDDSVDVRLQLTNKTLDYFRAYGRRSLLDRRFSPTVNDNSRKGQKEPELPWQGAALEHTDATMQPKIDESVVEKVEMATEALDEFVRTLKDAPAEASEAEDKKEDASAVRAAPNYDPFQKAIEVREKLRQSVRFTNSATWAKARGVRSNPSAALGKYKQKRRIFSVRSGRSDLYPTFQFGENNAEPLPIIEAILKVVPKEAQGWPLLSWFEAKNVLLNDRKPSEVLASDPNAVLRAAVRFYSRDND